MMCVCHCAVPRQPELMNGTEMKANGSESLVVSEENDVETYEVLCAPPVTNQMWQMASGYIGAVLMLVMAVYARCDNCCISVIVTDNYSADVDSRCCLHSSAAVGWQRCYLTLPQQLSISFVNKLKLVK